ncbi:hypothetical protein ACLMJK_002357 [Lecanora helva]
MPLHSIERAANPDDNRAEKKAIPKFASFRPKGNEREQLNDTLPHDESVHLSLKNQLKYRKHVSRNEFARSYGDHRDEQSKAGFRQELSDRANDHNEETGPHFVADRTGDPNNLTFGALHRYATSTYSRLGAGTVLGSLPGQKLDRSPDNERDLVLSKTDHSQWRRKDRKALWKTIQFRQRELKVTPTDSKKSSPVNFNADFVAFEATKRVKRRRGSGNADAFSSTSSDGEDIHYRSIGGKAKFQADPQDRDLTFTSDMSSSSGAENKDVANTQASLSRERAALLRKLDENPSDSDVWLELIRRQSDIFRSSRVSRRTGLTAAERRSTAEVKLSMCYKALKVVQNSTARETLLVYKMQEAQLIWDNRKLALEWQNILEAYPVSLALWNDYLNFKQTTFASFRYEEVFETYTHALTWLKNSQLRQNVCVTERRKLYKVQMYILLRMTLYMTESGFTEQAVAAWQALLEFQLFRPAELGGSKNEKVDPLHRSMLSRFEQFWDGEVSRIGENGWLGWAGTEQRRGESHEAKTQTVNRLDIEKDLWSSWVRSERAQKAESRMPARTTDDTVEDDPYRVILFSDIQTFLIELPSVVSRDVTIDVFLAFCRLPPYIEDGDESSARSWWLEGYIHNDLLDFANDKLLLSMNPSLRRENSTIHNSMPLEHEPINPSSTDKGIFSLLTADYRLSSDNLFASHRAWFSTFEAWCDNCSENNKALERAWVLRTLRHIVSAGIGGEDLAEYVLALELRFSPDTVKKTARGLLKKQPSSLKLYNAYALIDYRLGNASAGEKTLLTSIRMSESLDEASQRNAILLWRSWTWELLTAGDTRKALELLLMYGEDDALKEAPYGNLSTDQSPSSSKILRAERALTSTRDHLLSLGQYRLAVHAIDCFVLFTYLKSSSPLSAAASVFKSNCAYLKTYISHTNLYHELLHQSFARLLYHHITHTHIVKPADIRSLLTESITYFPQNTIFLSLYAWNEARFRIDDRVRSIVKDVVLTSNQDTNVNRSESVIPHFFAIYSELNRAVTFGSNVSTIRSTFERAVENGSSGAHCAGLWKMYFLFEHSRGGAAKAKNVFWRAIRACPWVKELYLLAFEYLRGPGGFSDEDLRGIYELMSEKELRIHVNLDDVFDAMKESKAP